MGTPSNERHDGSRANGFASVTIAIALAGVLVACGGRSGTSSTSGTTADQYVAGACTAMTAWGQDIKSEVSDLQTKVASAPDLAARKAIFVAFTKQLSATTDTLVTALHGLGAPAVAGGAAVHQQIVGAFESVQTTLQDAEQKAEALPTDDVAGFKKQVNAIGSEIGAIGNTFDNVGNLKNHALDSAYGKNATCQKMRTIFSS